MLFTALASFLMALSDGKARQPFQELVPAMLQSIADALATNAEDSCRNRHGLLELATHPPTARGLTKRKLNLVDLTFAPRRRGQARRWRSSLRSPNRSPNF